MANETTKGSQRGRGFQSLGDLLSAAQEPKAVTFTERMQLLAERPSYEVLVGASLPLLPDLRWDFKDHPERALILGAHRLTGANLDTLQTIMSLDQNQRPEGLDLFIGKSPRNVFAALVADVVSFNQADESRKNLSNQDGSTEHSSLTDIVEGLVHFNKELGYDLLRYRKGHDIFAVRSRMSLVLIDTDHLEALSGSALRTVHSPRVGGYLKSLWSDILTRPVNWEISPWVGASQFAEELSTKVFGKVVKIEEPRKRAMPNYQKAVAYYAGQEAEQKDDAVDPEKTVEPIIVKWPLDPQEIFSTKKLAAIFGWTTRRLEGMRERKQGPEYTKADKSYKSGPVFYLGSDVNKWRLENLHLFPGEYTAKDDGAVSPGSSVQDPPTHVIDMKRIRDDIERGRPMTDDVNSVIQDSSALTHAVRDLLWDEIQEKALSGLNVEKALCILTYKPLVNVASEYGPPQMTSEIDVYGEEYDYSRNPHLHILAQAALVPLDVASSEDLRMVLLEQMLQQAKCPHDELLGRCLAEIEDLFERIEVQQDDLGLNLNPEVVANAEYRLRQLSRKLGVTPKMPEPEPDYPEPEEAWYER